MKKKIIVIQTAFLGDTLLSIPLLKNIRSHFKDVEISFVCRKGFSDIFMKHGLIDYAYEVEKGSSNSYKDILKSISNVNFDYLISPHQSFRTHLFSLRVNAKIKIGYKKLWNFFIFNMREIRPMSLPEALRQIYLLKSLKGFVLDLNKINEFSLSNESYTKNKVEFKNSFSDLWSMKIGEGNKRLSKTVAIAPGSVWATKMWRKEYFSKLCKDLMARGYEVHLIGSKAEAQICNEIENENKGVLNNCGKFNLTELHRFMLGIDLVVSNDSGAMHMASAADCKIVSIFGPTVLEIGYQPWSEKAVVLQAKLDCRPCGMHGHMKCPIGTHECMKLVKPSSVLEVVEGFSK